MKAAVTGTYSVGSAAYRLDGAWCGMPRAESCGRNEPTHPGEVVGRADHVGGKLGAASTLRERVRKPATVFASSTLS